MQTDMLVNASSSSMYCMDVSAGLYISVTFNTTKILLPPLFILVLYLGHQRWRQQRSFSTTSHSDIFTYHMAAIELIYAFGGTVAFCGIYTEVSEVVIVGAYLSSMAFPGQTCFHLLTCVERYLAVVHPITYMGLRQSGGIKIRNISIGCVWLLSLVWSAVTVHRNFLYVLHFCLLVVSLVVVSFCSLRVLCVLLCPGPGEVGRDRKQVDQPKQRPFHTIAAITAVLWFSFHSHSLCKKPLKCKGEFTHFLFGNHTHLINYHYTTG
ncbi:uncharacterized protein LOC144459911 [Epinephelus lanceolatus]